MSLAKYPVLAVGLVGAAFSLIKTGRDAVFFTRTGLQELPSAYLWTEIGLGLFAYVHLSAMKRWGSRKTRLGVMSSAALLFLACAPFIEASHRTLVQVLFPIVPVLFAALFATAWLLAGDLLEGGEPKVVQRAYVYTGASAMVGGIAGGLFAKLSSPTLPPGGLVAAGGVCLLIAAGVSHRAHLRKVVAPGENPRAAESPADLLAILKSAYTRRLLIISALASLAAMYVEFQFYAAAYASGRAGPDFFADYYVVLCVASLLLQLAVAPFLQSRFGVRRALLVLPAGVLGGAGLVAMMTSVFTQSLFRVVETGLKNSIHRSSWEQVFLHFDREKRAAVKVMIDGTVPRLAGVLGAVVLQLVLLTKTDVTVFPIWVILPVALLWVYTTSVLGAAQEEPRPAEIEHQVRIPDS